MRRTQQQRDALLKALLSQRHRIQITEGQRRAILDRLERKGAT